MIRDGRLTGYAPAGRILVSLAELGDLVFLARCVAELRG
jgi:hypothetical protein